MIFYSFWLNYAQDEIWFCFAAEGTRLVLSTVRQTNGAAPGAIRTFSSLAEQPGHPLPIHPGKFCRNHDPFKLSYAILVN